MAEEEMLELPRTAKPGERVTVQVPQNLPDRQPPA